MDEKINYAPGWPGIPARWTSSAKSGVGTALNNTSCVWFTISHGILNEIYYPRVDQACTRDMGFIITNGKDYFSEEKRDTESEVKYLSKGAPAYHLTNKSRDKYYKLEKEIIADPLRDCILQKIKFTALKNKSDDWRLYALLAPHLANKGAENTGWVGDYKGTQMLFAQRESFALAVACSVPWKNRSVGFVGASDGWQDLHENKELTKQYDKAENGNIGLTGEISLNEVDENSFVIAIGFGINYAEAAQRAIASIEDGFDKTKNLYINEWENWQKKIFPLKDGDQSSHDLYRVSASILRTHEAKKLPGGFIASLSIPWGFSKGDDDLGGYHLVWPRDLAESAGGLIAIKAHEDAKRVLNYLMLTQEEDGHWAQNMWLDGTPYWSGIQMDETAFPILLVDLARRKGTLKKQEVKKYWQMVKRAVQYLVCNGPVTQQDRWEEDPGYSPFTLAVEIAALLAAADIAELCGEGKLKKYLQQTADVWNDNIERWTYVTETDWANQIGVEGYYVRIAPPNIADAASSMQGFVPVKNRPPGDDSAPEIHMISPDALALVRFGLRAYNDERILNTIKIIDAKLKVDTPYGPCWHRYNSDGWGEHKDGSPFDGTGTGRVWPLLTGERAHYEIAAGRIDNAKKLKKSLESFSNSGGMIPEQIWDSEDIPERELFFGKPAGSAMPLVWAHAEYIKLRRSLMEEDVFDMPPQTYKRYVTNKTKSDFAAWKFNNKCHSIPKGKILRIEALANARVRWTSDNWESYKEIETTDTELGVFKVDLPTNKFSKGDKIAFTFYWIESGNWENQNFTVEIGNLEI
jgi:glucoamylase